MDISFPLYRKYPHERTFFKITSAETFEQLDIIGDAFHIHQFTAQVYPDRVLILDMIEKKDGYWLDSHAAEYEEKLASCKRELKAL